MNEITSEVFTSISNLQPDNSIPTSGNTIITVKQEVEDDSYDVVSTVTPESVPSVSKNEINIFFTLLNNNGSNMTPEVRLLLIDS